MLELPDQQKQKKKGRKEGREGALMKKPLS
jgi:hypothetical protein